MSRLVESSCRHELRRFVTGKVIDMDDALFNLNGIGSLATTRDPENEYDWISAQEISKIRSAFTEAALDSQKERKDFVQRTLGRDISSLREVQSHEVTRLLFGLNDIVFNAKLSTADKRSAWDEREEDTWIDRL